MEAIAAATRRPGSEVITDDAAARAYVPVERQVTCQVESI
jgi:hypothetical protein